MKCGTTILVTTCNNIVSINIKLSLVSPKVLFRVLSSLHSVHACMHACMQYTNCCMLQQQSNMKVLSIWEDGLFFLFLTKVTWTSSAGRFLIGWGSFLEGESLLSIDEGKKKESKGEIKGYKICQHRWGRRESIRTMIAYFCFLSWAPALWL